MGRVSKILFPRQNAGPPFACLKEVFWWLYKELFLSVEKSARLALGVSLP